MKQIRCALFLLVLVFAAFNIKAQKTIVRGMVIDAETKEPLPFVNLLFKDSKVGTSSDMDGKYQIETYYPTDSLFASFIGYQRQGKRVVKDKIQTINFELNTGDGVQLQEVEVKYKGNPAHNILRR